MLTSLDWQLQKKVRVLIATDDTTLSERLSAFLEQSGDTRPIATASTGRECLEIVKNQAPDVLLISDTLVGENTLDICREAIHIHPRVAPIVLAQSARHADSTYLHQALNLGICDVLRVERPYADLRYQQVVESVLQAYNLIQERISGIGGGIGRLVALFSMKGGVGTSTLSANLAHLLWAAEQRRRVILADFNWRFGSLDAYTGHTAHQSILDLIPVLDGISRTDLESVSPPIHAGLRLLPAPLDSERLDFTRDLLERDVLEDDRATLIDDLLVRLRERQPVEIMPHQADFLELLLKKEKIKQILAVLGRRTLQSLRRNYHYVVADTGNQLDDATLTTLELADLVVLVCTPDVPSVRATRAAMNLLLDLGIGRDSVGYVINRAHRRADIGRSDVQSLFVGYEMLGEIPDDLASLQPYQNTGTLIAEARNDLPLTKAMHSFADAVASRVPLARAA
jgi:pilus assembly protein CpaE